MSDHAAIRVFQHSQLNKQRRKIRETSRARDRAIIGLILGTAISTSFYALKYISQWRDTSFEAMLLVMILAPFGILSVVPQVFSVLIPPDLGALHWLVFFIAFSYWPLVCMAVIRSKRWKLWAIVVIAFHLGVDIMILLSILLNIPKL
ncbi:MAG TPA: hypothetical protein VFC63_07055 [Blastocatellia bacterium]|nr:hypothetical protein [Blastocatellia bacterium]